MLTELEKKVIASIQGDIPLTDRPYRMISQALGISEEKLLTVLADLCARGVIRRFGATLRHQKSGFEANAMTAWKVAEERIDEVGRIMAKSRHVSHCYRRSATKNWPYNLYTMIHGRDEEACKETAQKLAEKADVNDYVLLFSKKELKKTSMAYFPEDNIEQL